MILSVEYREHDRNSWLLPQTPASLAEGNDSHGKNRDNVSWDVEDQDAEQQEDVVRIVDQPEAMADVVQGLGQLPAKSTLRSSINDQLVHHGRKTN